MDFNDYQKFATSTAVYPDQGTVRGLEYVVLGLCGEAGSVANQVKKIFRDDGGELTSERRAAILRQLGDTLWYISQTCTELLQDFEGLAKGNVEKLYGRQVKGTLHGDGDAR